MITPRMEALQEAADSFCPGCGLAANAWDKSPFGYAYCACGQAWKIQTIRVKYILFSDPQGRVHVAHAGYAVVLRSGEVVHYITELS